MATQALDVDIEGIKDPQQPIAFSVGLVLIVVGIAGLTGIIDADVGFGPGLVFGLFGVPFWLGVTALVAGVIGIVLSMYPGAGTTFNKVASGLVLPAVILLAISDWGLAAGNVLTFGVALVTLLLAVVLVVVGVVLLYKRPLALVLPVVAVLTIVDWVLGLSPSAIAPASEAVTIPTIILLIVLALIIGFIAFEGGRRTT